MKSITISKGEPLCVYAVCVFGWGRGETVGAALANMYEYARGGIEPKRIVEDLTHQRMSLYLSNEVDGIRIENFTPRPSEGKWVIHLGDEYNGIKFYEGVRS